MKIVAFAASNSSKSINRTLAAYAAGQVAGAQVTVLDLNDYEMPIFSEDREREHGHPDAARQFLADIASADALVIGYAEHNGSFSAAYKNVVDWASRIERKVFQQKPTLALATSPGARGGQGVLELAVKFAPYFGAEIVSQLSIPSFHQHFDSEAGVLHDATLAAALQEELDRLVAATREPATAVA